MQGIERYVREQVAILGSMMREGLLEGQHLTGARIKRRSHLDEDLGEMPSRSEVQRLEIAMKST